MTSSLSCHPLGNNITKLWKNTVTPGKLKDKLRGFRCLNLFKVLMHEQEIYVAQKLHKLSFAEKFSFECQIFTSLWKQRHCIGI